MRSLWHFAVQVFGSFTANWLWGAAVSGPVLALGWQWGIGIAVAAAIISFGIGWFAAVRWKRRVEFHETRNDRLPQFPDEISGGKEVWLAWHTGSHAYLNRYLNSRNTGDAVKKLLLLDPTGDVVTAYSHAYGETTSKIRDDVKKTTEQAATAGITVRWFDGPITHMTILRPKYGKGWVRVEVAPPFSTAIDRPSFKVSQRSHPETCERLINWYLDAWKVAREPRPNEYEQKKDEGTTADQTPV